MAPLLVMDTDQTATTGCFTLYTADRTEAFTFVTPEDAKQFAEMWFKNKHSARFAYARMVREMDAAISKLQRSAYQDDVFLAAAGKARPIWMWFNEGFDARPI